MHQINQLIFQIQESLKIVGMETIQNRSQLEIILALKPLFARKIFRKNKNTMKTKETMWFQ